MTSSENLILQTVKSPQRRETQKDIKTRQSKPLKSEKITPRQLSVPKMPETIWMLTTYPPRECGIATFSQDLRQAMTKVFATSVQVKIAAIDNTGEERKYPGEVDLVFHPDSPLCYKHLAAEINGNFNAKALVIQHEFGLFPDKYQHEFLYMLSNINKPVMVVMHTVLPNPDEAFRRKVIDLVNGVSKVIVMTKLSARILQRDYNVSSEKIEIIPHGTHLTGYTNKEDLKEKYGLSGRTVLSTFGLISRNKSIETSLRALPEVVAKYPEVIFLALGRTHPEVLKHQGEEYREELGRIVKENKLENNVRFVNHYLSLEELLEYLQATDIYLFTSKDPGQAVSGTFSYAMSAGCAMVSTPIPHATELLENGAGLLFNFEDSQSLQEQLFKYLDQPAEMEEYGKRARQTISGTAWENIANKYFNSVKSLWNGEFDLQYRLPRLTTKHLFRMTTEKGIVQFAKYDVPDLDSGYTLDDNSRALLVAAMLYKENVDLQTLKLVEIYLDFITGCQKDDGTFINYKLEDGSESDENALVNLEDSNGRAVWALGFLTSMGKKFPASYVYKASNSIQKSISWIAKLESPRAIAFALKGLYYYQKHDPSKNVLGVCEKLATRLVAGYRHHRDDNWYWFEPYMTYGNSVLPEAMLISYKLTGNKKYERIAKESFDFLLAKTFYDGRMKVISNRGWLHKGKECEAFGEQPIDVAYTILGLDRFYNHFKDVSYLAKLKTAFNWFLGENAMRCIVYNPATGGCFDGMEETGANLNQGAESTISYLISRLTIHDYYLHDVLQERPKAVIVEDNFAMKKVI